MDATIAKMWIDALRSGEYKQGKYVLRNVTKDTWCCLGVLCDLYQKNCEEGFVLPTETTILRNDEETLIDEENDGAEVLNYDTNYNELPYEVANWAGMDTGRIGWRQGRIPDMGTYILLSELNDTRGLNFNQIAETIELNVEKM